MAAELRRSFLPLLLGRRGYGPPSKGLAAEGERRPIPQSRHWSVMESPTLRRLHHSIIHESANPSIHLCPSLLHQSSPRLPFLPVGSSRSSPGPARWTASFCSTPSAARSRASLSCP